MKLEELLRLSRDDFYVICNGKVVSDWTSLKEDDHFHVNLRIRGGKGGFGSLLRSFRIHKSSNQLMCRDLSGRRQADIKEEARLKKWIEKSAEREAEKQRKKNEKYEKLKRGPPKHEFEDQTYIQQREEILDRTDDAFEQGLRAAQTKKKMEETAGSSNADGLGEKRKLSPDDMKDNGEEPKSKMTKTLTVVDDVNTKSETKPKKNKSDTKIKTSVIIEKPPPPKLTKQQKKELYETEKKKAAVMASSSCSNFVPTLEIDLNDYENGEQLQAIGMDHLRVELQRRGLKCGGSLEERASRLFSIKGLQPAEYPKNQLATKKN